MWLVLTHLSNLVAHCAPRGDRATRRNIERVVFEVRIEMAYVNSMIMCGLPLLLISTIQLLPRRLRIVFSIAFCQQHLPVRLFMILGFAGVGFMAYRRKPKPELRFI